MAPQDLTITRRKATPSPGDKVTVNVTFVNYLLLPQKLIHCLVYNYVAQVSTSPAYKVAAIVSLLKYPLLPQIHIYCLVQKYSGCTMLAYRSYTLHAICNFIFDLYLGICQLSPEN